MNHTPAITIRTCALVTVLTLFCSLSPPSFACINTSYSRAEEQLITDNLAQLIIGAFPHHGRAFYEHEVSRNQALLEKDPDDFVARNDLASAYTKLQKWDLALEHFEENERLHPGRYETASNLGVLYKKKGEYETAAAASPRNQTGRPYGARRLLPQDDPVDEGSVK